MRRMTRLLAKHTGGTFWGLLDQGTTLMSSTLSFLLLGRTLVPREPSPTYWRDTLRILETGEHPPAHDIPNA